MLTKQRVGIITVLLVILLITTFSPIIGCSKKDIIPPSTTNLNEIHYLPVPINDDSQETNMLVNGQSNMIPSITSLSEVEKLKTSKEINIYFSEKGGFTISCVFFNMRRRPFDEQAFREAIARIINRDYVVNKMLKGLVISCSTFVPPLSDDWTNKAATAPGFDSIRAAKMLDEAGYRFDKDSKTRIDPKTNKPLNLTIITPMQNTNPVLWDIGYMVTYYINGLGIKADHVALPDYLYQPRAMQSRDYDILVQDITMSQATFSLYPLLHSSRDQGWTYAFSGIHDSALDTKLEQLWFGLDLQAAQKASLDAQNILAKNLPYVAVCSVPVFSAIKGQWDGVVTMPGIGASNIWTYQSIHPADKNQDMILQLTAPGGINSLNPLMASSVAEWRILQQIYSPLLYIDPMSMKDTPLLAGSWNIEAWTAPTGGKGMKVTFHLVDGVKWQDGMPFTSQDIKFCIDFIKSHNVPRYKDIINLVNDVQAPDKLTVEIFLNDRGYRYLYDLVWFTFLPQHIWSDVIDYQTFMPWKEVNPQNKELTKLIGQGLYILKPGDLVNGAQLVRYKEHIFSYNNDKSK